MPAYFIYEVSAKSYILQAYMESNILYTRGGKL
jgi:hypothetical protein